MGCCGGPRQCPDFDADHEGLSEDDLARFGGDDAVCRNCGADFYADAPLCPRCGEAVLGESSGGGVRAAVFPLVVAGMVALMLVLVML